VVRQAIVADRACRSGNSRSALIEGRPPPLKDQCGEWLARIIGYAFSVPASAFVAQVDRALVRDAFATLPGERTADQIRSFHDLFDTLTPTAAIPGFRTKREQFLDRLRRLPSRADIHDLELRLGERMDSLAVRFDRAFDPHLS
jgi:hypothetical protein